MTAPATTIPSTRDGALPTGTGRTWPLRACYALNLVGAGVPGAVLLAAPHLAPEVAGAAAAPEVARLVGAVWTAFAVGSVVGLARPEAMRGILVAQVVYKGIYVAAVGVPALVAGTASPIITQLTAGFAGIAVAWGAALVASGRSRR